MNNILFELSDVYFDGLTEEVVNVNQPLLLGEICMNRITGIAYKNLKKAGIKFQKEFNDTLKVTYNANVKKAKAFKEYVEYVAKIFENANFKYALLKGAFLSSVLYEEGLRTSNDIDILVEEKDIQKCQNILKSNGFVQGSIDSNGKIIPATRREIIMSRMNYGETIPFVKKKDEEIWLIDINFSLDFKPEKDSTNIKTFLEHAYKVDINTEYFYTLDMYDFFIHLCCHLYKEATTYFWVLQERDLQLYKFSDINLFFNKVLNMLDMNEMTKRIKMYDTQKEVFYTITNSAVIYPKLKNNKAYIELTDKIKPTDMSFMKQIYDPENNKTYYYEETFDEWFSMKEKVKRLKEI